MKIKMISLLIGLTCFSQIMHAQVSKPNFATIDPLRFLSGLAFNLGYEYSIKENISIGAEMMFNAQNHEWIGKNNIGVFGRFYLDGHQQFTQGFFGEVFTRYSTWNVTKTNASNIKYQKEVTDMSLGFGGGYKYMFSSSFGIDCSAGLGRFLFAGEDVIDWKLQVCLGWAF